MEKMIRQFTITIAAVVDDASKPEYKAPMDEVCRTTFNELKAILRSRDHGTGRISIDIQPVTKATT